MAALLPHLHTHLLSPPEPAALPTLLPLLALHQPFATAAGPTTADARAKFVRALDALVVGKDERARVVGWVVAREVLAQEARGGPRARDGGCVERYGRSWVTTLVGLAGQKKLPEVLLHPYAGLLSTVFLTASLSPQFQRESVLPQLQKVVLALLSFFPPSAPLSSAHVDAILPVLPALVNLHPASLRPLQALLQALALRALTHAGGSAQTKKAAVDLSAALPALVGKSAMPQAFHAAVLAALESAHQGADALFDGVVDEAVRERDGEGVKFAAWDDQRREKDGWKRRATGKGRVEGGIRLVAGLLRQSTERAVPVPIGSVLALALRLFRITPASPLASNASQEDANLTLSLLPELHALACALVGQLGLAVGPSMMPHMTEVSSHLVYLLEQTSSPLAQTTLQSTLALLFEHVGPWAPSRDVSASLVDRATKASLRVLGSALLPSRESSGADDDETTGEPTEGTSGGGAKGKGKKRAAETLGGSLLATASLALSPAVLGALSASLSLVALVLPHPALPPATHALATKVLLSIAYSLPHSSVVGGRDQLALERRVEEILAQGVESGPVAREGGVGPELGWVVNAIGSSSKTSNEVSKFLNPLLPPTHQPLPSLEASLLYLPPGPTEAGTRIELGFALGSDTVRVVSTDAGDDDVAMDVVGTDDGGFKAAPNFPAVVAPTTTRPADAAAAIVQDPFALPVLAPVAAPTALAPAAPAPAQDALVAPPPVAVALSPAAAPALQPLPTAAPTGIELAAPVPSDPSAPVTGGWQGAEHDADGGADGAGDESDEEMPEIDMGDDTDEDDE